ncbi:MAG TPA: LysM peptidoglycan-binding domain-containing protein [Actinomycetota bacterium]|nr:LysM peptidoglycan-binding domain-containing protein [Actinomycetota bacterium]
MTTNRRSRVRAFVVAAGACLLVMFAKPALWAGAPGSVPPPVVHVVAPGETLWSLAEHYAPQEDPRQYIYDLQQANNLGDGEIYTGEKLTLP